MAQSTPDNPPGTEQAPEAAASSADRPATAAPGGAPGAPSTSRVGDFSGLPAFTRSLLKIPVPVTVTLARKKQTTREVLELAIGSIIKFDKSCNELLDLTVGEQSIADGEVVKVGEKFGLRIHKIYLPRERFATVRGAT